MNWWMCFIILLAISRSFKSSLSKTAELQMSALICADLLNSLYCELTPSSVTVVFVNHFLKVEIFVELVCFRSGITQESFLIQSIRNLSSDKRQRVEGTYREIPTSSIFFGVMCNNLLPVFCSSTVVNGKGFHF